MLKNLTDEQKHIRLDEQKHIRLLWQLGCDLRSSIDGIKIDQRKMQAKIEAMQAMKGVRIKAEAIQKQVWFASPGKGKSKRRKKHRRQLRQQHKHLVDAPEGPLTPPPLLAEVEPELPKQTAAEEEDRCNGMMAKHSGPVVTVGDMLHRIRTVIDTVHDLRTDTGYQHALKGYLQEMKMASEEPKAPAEQVETIAVQNRSPTIAVQNRWRKRLVARSAATEKKIANPKAAVRRQSLAMGSIVYCSMWSGVGERTRTPLSWTQKLLPGDNRMHMP